MPQRRSDFCGRPSADSVMPTHSPDCVHLLSRKGHSRFLDQLPDNALCIKSWPAPAEPVHTVPPANFSPPRKEDQAARGAGEIAFKIRRHRGRAKRGRRKGTRKRERGDGLTARKYFKHSAMT